MATSQLKRDNGTLSMRDTNGRLSLKYCRYIKQLLTTPGNNYFLKSYGHVIMEDPKNSLTKMEEEHDSSPLLIEEDDTLKGDCFFVYYV